MTGTERNKAKRLLTLIVAPVTGLAYVIALPFIAVATVVTLVGERILHGLISIVVRGVSYGWRPTEAYLTGKKRRKKEKK